MKYYKRFWLAIAHGFPNRGPRTLRVRDDCTRGPRRHDEICQT